MDPPRQLWYCGARCLVPPPLIKTSPALPRFRAARHCSARGTKPKTMEPTMGETDTAENSSIDENCTLWGVPCVLVRSVDPSFCSLQSLLSKVALKEPVILFLYFILNSYKIRHVKMTKIKYCTNINKLTSINLNTNRFFTHHLKRG